MKLNLTKHIDENWWWLQITKNVLKSLGKDVCNAISFFSKQDSHSVYLDGEEDAQSVLDALKRAGYDIDITEKKVEGLSIIRQMKAVNC